MSKTALNAAGKSLANDLKSKDISVAILPLVLSQPGWRVSALTCRPGRLLRDWLTGRIK